MRCLVAAALLCTCCLAQQPEIINRITALLQDSRFDEVVQLTNNLTDQTPHRNHLVNMRAEALIMLQRTTEAEQLLKSETEKPITDEERGNTLATLGFLYLNQGRTVTALELLQQALALQENTSPLPKARTLAFLGQLYNSSGKYAQAEEHLQVALSLRTSVLPENHELIAASYNDLGHTATATNPDKALDYFDKALEIYRALHGNEHIKIANTLTNAGIAYRTLKLYGDATVNFEEALRI